MSVVFDSSIWISSMKFSGIPRTATLYAADHDQVVVCEYIRDEIARNMAAKFGWSYGQIARDLALTWEKALWVTPTGALTGICRDPADDIIVECAILADAVLIVSGDKDLLDLQHYGKIRILTAREYVERAEAAAT